MTVAIDWAWARPDLAAVKAAGYSAVLRYLSHDTTGKDITAAELAAIRAVGLGVGFVWETTATRPTSGAAGGSADGAEVGRRLDALGVPRSVPVFYALDSDDRGVPGWQASMGAYLNAAASASGRRALPYGSVRVVDYFGGGWQTCAWSGDAVSTHAALYQRSRPTLAMPSGCDEDAILDASVLWQPPGSAPVPTSASTVQSSTTAPGGGHVAGLPVLREGSKGQYVRNWQSLVGVAVGRACVVDGDFGPSTTAATKVWQAAAGIDHDGIVGPSTWGRMLGATVTS